MSIDTIIFDLDGTLLDTLPDIAGAMNQVLADAGLPVHHTDRYRDFIGDGIDTLVRQALPPNTRHAEMIQQSVASMREIYRSRWARRTRLYPGIAGMLAFCSGAGLKMAILSNKPDGPTREMAAHFFPDHPFDHVQGARPDVPIKPDPTAAIAIADRLGTLPEACMFLGDMPVDIKTGRRAGMAPIGALWGYRTADELTDAGASHLLHTPEALASLIGIANG